VTVPADDAVKRADAAVARNGWTEAFDAYSSVETQLRPADLEAFARIALLCSKPQRAIELNERAFAGYVAAGEQRAAARAAMALYQMHSNRRSKIASESWLRKAEQLLADQPECAEHGQLHWAFSMRDDARGDADAALAHATRALEIAENVGDRDGCALALMRKGRVLVKQGDAAGGMALVDESMIAALSGELSPIVTGRIYCATIDACQDTFDFNRAAEWTDATGRWCERTSVSGFPGICRVHRAEILRLRGAWIDAQAEAIRASDELREFGTLHIVGHAFYELGEIRLRTGDLEAAADAFRQAHEHGRDPQPGLALLWLQQGRAHAANNAIAQAVAEIGGRDPLRRARLRPAQVEIAIAAGDLATASAAADDLDAIGGTVGAPAPCRSRKATPTPRSRACVARSSCGTRSTPRTKRPPRA
jgi:tetratricopeptide (TPR) repeat protein